VRQSYLESYYNLIPKTQQERLMSVLKSRYDAVGQTATDADFTNQIKELIAGLQQPLGHPLIQLRKATKYGKIVSKDYNNTMDEAFVDLGALFKQNNNINKTIKVHRLINESVLRDIKAALATVENDIVVHKVIKENKTGITDVKFNSFYKADNLSIDSVYAAQTDTETNSIKLPKGLDHSSLSIDGLAMADIDIFHFGGGIKGTIEDESHRKELAIDGSTETFWGEVILVDEPIRQVYAGETQFGAVCEVVISLFRADLVNNIRLNPFTNYPMTILGIYYKPSVNSDWVDIGVEKVSSTTTVEFNFSEVIAKQIKIVINQRNPSINTYKIPKRIINNAQLWQQIVDREFSISTETDVPIQATQDMIDYITGWQAYVDATKSYEATLKSIGKPSDYEQTQSISESIFDAATKEMTKSGGESVVDPLKLDLYSKKPEVTDELIEVRKYEYVYGAYNIDIRKIWYLETGEYISPMYIPNGAVLEARLDTSEVVPSGTSIEYQVATRPEEWKNILPSGGYILQERVDIDSNTQTGYIRFPCSGSIDGLYRNGNVIPVTDYVFNSTDSSVVVASGWYTATSAYTVAYEPKGVTDITPSGVIVNFAGDSLLDADETYAGVGSRQFKIDAGHYPYIEYSIINDTSKAGKSLPSFSDEDGRWLNISGVTKYGIASGEYYDILRVTVNGFDSINRTDYLAGIRPALTAYDEIMYPYYEYIHSGKSLYFNTPLADKEVKVKYKYLNDFIQLRALLRNNSRGNVSMTPILNDFTLKLRTI